MQPDNKPGPRNRSGHGPRITTTLSDSIPSLVLGSSVLTDEPVSFANLPGTLSRKGTQPLSHSGGDSSAEEDYAGSSPSRSPASPESPPARHLRRLSYSRERIYPHKGQWQSGETFRFPLSNPEENAWESIHKLVKDYDKGMCAGWRDEIEKVIIFAGLFAATVVAFLAVSYLMLKQDPQEVQNEILRHIATQFDILVAVYANGTLPNAVFSPLSPPPASPKTFHPPSAALRMNGTMFLSMTMALSTVLLGTTCLQWIREYERDARLGPKEAAALRQMRFEGLNYWGVPLIISSLPILLQLAVGLFFWGLCEFLWVLNCTVTTINVAAIGVACFFVLFTVTLPAFQSIFIAKEGMGGHQVPFKSPQARWFAVIAFWWARASVWLLIHWKPESKFFKDKQAFLEKLSQTSDWVSFDTAWQSERLVSLDGISAQESRDVPRVIAWVARVYVYSQVAIAGVYRTMREMYPSTSIKVLQSLLPREARPDIDGFARKVRDTHAVIVNDIKAALLLDQLVKNNPQLAAPLLHIRTELFVRIINYNSHDALVGPNTEWNVWDLFSDYDKNPQWSFRLLIPFAKDEQYLLLPDALKLQLLLSFKAYLKIPKFRDILWEIVLPLVTEIITSQPEISEELCVELSSINQELQTFLACSRSNPHMPAIQNRLNKYISDVHPGAKRRMWLNCNHFLQQLQDLERHLNPSNTLSAPPRNLRP